MTIKELEQRVGMTRTNIRFYEQEGLLTPARHPNGYRDYSEADAETLEKIKLLRRLHLDLDTIRALQKGERTLSDALARQLEQLADDRSALDGAMEVCERLQAEGTDYTTLRPALWLEELDRAPASERLSPPEDRLPPPPGHPWQRFFARSFDLFLYGFPFTVLARLVFHLSLDTLLSTWYSLFHSYLAIGVMFLAEPLMLHRWGTTPGKALFGIRMKTRDGDNPTYGQALHRLWLVFSKGMGYGIPVYQLFRYYKSYSACQSGERLAWEGPLPFREEDPAMTVPDGVAPFVRYGAVRLVCLGLSLLVGLLALMPPHHNGLTEEDFYENWNFYAHLTGVTSQRLGPDGRFPEEEDSMSDIIFNTEHQWSPIYEGDTLVGFRCVMEGSTYKGSNLFFLSYTNNTTLSLLAWAGGQSGSDILKPALKECLEWIPEDKVEYDLTYDSIRITQKVETTNLTPLSVSNSGIYEVIDKSQIGYLRLEFTARNVSI